MAVSQVGEVEEGVAMDAALLDMTEEATEVVVVTVEVADMVAEGGEEEDVAVAIATAAENLATLPQIVAMVPVTGEFMFYVFLVWLFFFIVN